LEPGTGVRNWGLRGIGAGEAALSQRRCSARCKKVLVLEEPRRAVVDSYALPAMVFWGLSKRAIQLLQYVGRRRTRVLLVTVVYEYIVHWRRGRIPGSQLAGRGGRDARAW